MLARQRLGLTAFVLTLLAGCATTVQVPGGEQTLSRTPPKNWPQRLASLGGFNHWQLQGKLAISEPGHNETAVINRWRQHGREFELRVASSFMGLGSTELSGDPGFVNLTTGSGKNYVSAQPGQLLKRELGWTLPLANLPYWVKGIPNPDQPANLFFDDQGQLKRLEQNGWAVHYRRPRRFIKDLPLLPGLITANKGPVRIRVAVLQWRRLTDNNP